MILPNSHKEKETSYDFVIPDLSGKSLAKVGIDNYVISKEPSQGFYYPDCSISRRGGFRD